MKLEPIAFALSDESRGYHITPERVPQSVLSAFSNDVQDFIKGAGKDIDVSAVDVRIREGSLALEAGPIFSESLLADLKILAGGQDLTRVSVKRREIIKKWQGQAKKGKSFAVRVTSPWLGRDIVVSSATDFRETGIARQVNVERYIRGEILDLGGVTDSNADMMLPNPKFDAERFNALVRNGREAWREVGDPAEWIRSIRGDD